MISLFIGRFQPFHKGHLDDVMKASQSSDQVIVAIGSSQQQKTIDNPFSYDERKEMILRSVEKNDIDNITIVGVSDIFDDSKWVSHVANTVGKFDVVYTGNEHVLNLFIKAGYPVNKIILIPNISATEIRSRIIKAENWGELVPSAVYEYLMEIDGEKRIRSINANKNPNLPKGGYF